VADILWRVFYILTETVPYTFVSVDRRASLFCRFADTNIYGTDFVKMWKTLHKVSMDWTVDVGIFFTVQSFSLLFTLTSYRIVRQKASDNELCTRTDVQQTHSKPAADYTVRT